MGAKEAVIFEQFGQLAGITAYLHVHVELSISSVEAQLGKYRQLLKQNCDSELSVLNYMLTYVNTSITNFTLKKAFPDRPEDFPEKSMIRQNAKLWYKVAQLHLRDLEAGGQLADVTCGEYLNAVCWSPDQAWNQWKAHEHIFYCAVWVGGGIKGTPEGK